MSHKCRFNSSKTVLGEESDIEALLGNINDNLFAIKKLFRFNCSFPSIEVHIITIHPRSSSVGMFPQ